MARGPLSLFSQPVTAHPEKAARLSGLSRQRFSALAHPGGTSISSTRLVFREDRLCFRSERPSLRDPERTCAGGAILRRPKLGSLSSSSLGLAMGQAAECRG